MQNCGPRLTGMNVRSGDRPSRIVKNRVTPPQIRVKRNRAHWRRVGIPSIWRTFSCAGEESKIGRELKTILAPESPAQRYGVNVSMTFNAAGNKNVKQQGDDGAPKCGQINLGVGLRELRTEQKDDADY